LRVYENMFLGRELIKGKMFSNRREMRRLCAEALSKIGADVPPDAFAAELGVAQKQKVEIAKAMLCDSALLIMDEPTTVLNHIETGTLFRILRAFREHGGSVVFITHKLGELCELCDEVAVMRDARLVFRADSAGLAPAGIAGEMVGGKIENGEFGIENDAMCGGGRVVRQAAHSATATLQFSISNSQFTIFPGEILGLAGLAGAGRTELAEAICGLRPHGGEIKIGGAPVKIRSMTDAIHHGIAYLPEDRQATGLLYDWGVAANTTLASLRKHSAKSGFVRRGECRATTAEYVRKFGIKLPGLDAPVSSLSGGNQQKVAIAKWTDTKPKLFIFDEPTRGVDIAARADIYGFLRSLAERGVACLLISSDFGEIVANCRRVLVMRSGRVAGELADGEVSENNLMALATGS